MFRRSFGEGEVMVEVMSQVNHQEMLKLPKNIRQIGLPEDKRKIYVEDYVVTYMNQLAAEYPNQQSAAVLLGFYTRQKDMRLTFINGAIGIPAAKVEDDQISFSSDLWEEVYDIMRKYFRKCEIVGWFLTRPGKSLGINEKITKIHVDQFPGKEKTLFLMDPLDKEEAFFIYENGKLTRQHGYYIYYERNEEMQNYMIENRKGKGTEEVLEAADLKKVTHLYKHPEKWQSPKKEKKSHGKKIMGTVAAALLLVVLGMNIMNRLYVPNAAKTVGNVVQEEPLTIQVVEETSEINKENEMNMESEAGDMSVSAGTNSGIRYTVRKGDTLVNISIGLYDSMDYVDLICEMNGIDDPDLIYEGMILELP